MCTRMCVEFYLSPLSDVTRNHTQTGKIFGNVVNVEITAIISTCFLGAKIFEKTFLIYTA